MEVGAILPRLPHSANDDPLAVAHPCHRGFVERIGGRPEIMPMPELGPLNRTVLRDVVGGLRTTIEGEYDAYLVVGASALYALPRVARRDPDATVVLLAADFRFNGLGSYALSLPRELPTYLDRWLDASLLGRLVDRHVDALLAVSELMADAVTRGSAIPTGITHPYVSPERYAALADRSPDLASDDVVVVCEAREHKGVDLLVAAWPDVVTAHPDAHLHIVGKDHPARYERTPAVTVHGYVEDLGGLLEQCSLYVHPARFDAFAVSVLEAMRLGLPPLITTGTGTVSVLRDVDPSLIVDPEPTALASGVTRYLDRDLAERRELSEAVQQESTVFQRDSRLATFESEFDRVLAAARE